MKATDGVMAGFFLYCAALITFVFWRAGLFGKPKTEPKTTLDVETLLTDRPCSKHGATHWICHGCVQTAMDAKGVSVSPLRKVSKEKEFKS